ncbi:MAG: hypothetical protein IJ173_02815 [Kiritimatiellae bacterium]|nr:hypothetical protein [Kiritimatiellia bacterium]
MKKIMMVAGAVALAGMIAGCATTGAAEEDKVAKWQRERTPVEVLKSRISVKAAGAIVEALDVAPFGIYKAIADKVDKAAVMDRYRKIYLGYVGDIQALEQQGKSKDDARKEVYAALAAQENGADTIAKLNEYLKTAKETNFEAVSAWIAQITDELAAASQKFANETPNALNQLVEIAQKEGGLAVVKIPSQGKDDIAVVGQQLADAGIGLKLYVEMTNADKDAAAMQAEYPVEG